MGIKNAPEPLCGSGVFFGTWAGKGSAVWIPGLCPESGLKRIDPQTDGCKPGLAGQFVFLSPSTPYPNGKNELVKDKNNFLTGQGLNTLAPKIIFPSGCAVLDKSIFARSLVSA